MSAINLDGRALAAKIRERLKGEAGAFSEKHGRPAGLAVVLVGSDPASAVYVRNKIKGCEEVGIRSYSYRLPGNAPEKDVAALVTTLNEDRNVDGILIQLPLPEHINEQRILNAIDPRKDVDGFLAINVGKLLLGENTVKSCTPAGCMELIRESGTDLSGKHAVVVGRSNIVGKPVALLLLAENATVTMCHSKTANLAEITRGADVLVAAVGRAKLITADMVKPGAVVIDVGMNRDEAGKLCGDVDYDSVKEVASYITPVPGGVGPMTITMLLQNTLQAAQAKHR